MIAKVLGFLKGGGWVLILLAAGGLWLRAELRAAEARGAAREALAATERAVAAHLADSAAARAQQDSLRAVVGRLTAVLDTARARTARALNRAATDRLRADSALSLLGGLTAGDTAATGALGALSAALDTLRADLTACHAGLTACDSIRGADSVALAAALRRAQRADSLLGVQRETAARVAAMVRGGGGLPGPVYAAAGGGLVALLFLVFR